MLELVEVSSFLTKQLNNYSKGKTTSYEFDIRAEVGKYENGNVVYGVLRSNKPILPPVAGVKNIKYSLSVKLQVVSPLVNFNLKNIEEIIGEFVENWNGKEVGFSKGKGLLNLTLTGTNGFKTESGQGNIVPIEFDVGINYTENVVTSGAKHWLLDGIEIPFLSEDVIIEKNGVTKTISGDNFKKTLLTEQLKMYRFKFNYDVNSELCSKLQKDLLEGSANKKYTLKYFDGYSFVENDPFKTTVSIYRTGNTGSVKPDTSVFDITFTDVKVKNTIVYKLGLMDNPFDGQTEDTMYFNSVKEQQEWFDRKISEGCEFVEIQTPNLDSLDITNQVYEFDPEKYNVFDVTKKNYAVIKVEQGDNKYYFYYQITNPQIGAENQVLFTMQLDSLQTYYFMDEIKFEGSFIQKTLLNRWSPVYEVVNKGEDDRPDLQTAVSNGYYGRREENGVPKYDKVTEKNYNFINTFYKLDEYSIQFDGNVDSKLFEREEIKNVAKRLVQRKKLKYSTDYRYCLNINNEMVDWINDAVDFWVYFILDANTEYSMLGTQKITLNETSVVDFNKSESNNLGYSVAELCVPFMNTNDIDDYGMVKTYRIKTFGELDSVWDYEGLVPFFLKNGGYSHVKGVKISIKPPFMFDKDTFKYNIESYNNELNSQISLPYSNLNLWVGTVDDLGDNNENTHEFSLGGVDEKNHAYLSLNKRLLRTFFYAEGLPPGTITRVALIYEYDFKNPIYLEADINMPQVLFHKPSDEIRGYKNKKFNPKLNGEDYKELNLTFMGNTHSLPINKINQEKIIIKYTEMITPDTTKGIARVVIENKDGVFNKDYENSFNGFIFTNDLSLPISNGQLEQYLANNKNAYLSFQAQQEYNRETQNLSLMQSTIQGAFSASKSKSWGDLFGNVSQTATSMMFSEMQFEKGQALRQTQFDLSMDNMRNAPRTLVNANGNAIFGDAVSEFGMYLELYEGLDHELEIANDIMTRDGFTYNQFDNVKKYDKVRKFFNYIKANIGTITGIPISNQARADLRNRFASGVRFWNKDEETDEFIVDYSKENYEKWIETDSKSFEEWIETQNN